MFLSVRAWRWRVNRGRIRARILAALAGAVLAVFCIVGLIIAIRSDRLPQLNRVRFEEAFARWSDTAPDDYDVAVDVQGPTSGLYRVVVRGGEVRQATRNGDPLPQRRTWDTWTVPGMFRTIERDLLRAEQPPENETSGALPKMILRVEFDPRWAYPSRYQRIELGSHLEVNWQVVEFRVESDMNVARGR